MALAEIALNKNIKINYNKMKKLTNYIRNYAYCHESIEKLATTWNIIHLIMNGDASFRKMAHADEKAGGNSRNTSVGHFSTKEV